MTKLLKRWWTYGTPNCSFLNKQCAYPFFYYITECDECPFLNEIMELSAENS